jgi:hypothetical protein
MRLQRRCARMALSTASLPPSLGEWEVLVGRHPIAQLGGDRLEVARASKLHGAEAFVHLACELRDVTLLRCPDEDSLRAELLQLGCNRSAAFRIPLNPRHAPTLFALRPRSVGSSDMAAAWGAVPCPRDRRAGSPTGASSSSTVAVASRQERQCRSQAIAAAAVSLGPGVRDS